MKLNLLREEGGIGEGRWEEGGVGEGRREEWGREMGGEGSREGMGREKGGVGEGRREEWGREGKGGWVGVGTVEPCKTSIHCILTHGIMW